MSKVKEVTSENQFNDFLRNSGGKLVVVDWFATWCGPCQAAAPQYANLSNKYSNVVFLKVDTDKNKNLSATAGVRALPTFMLYKNNTKLTSFEGADMQKLENLIMQYGDAFEAFKGSGKTLSSGTQGLAGNTYDRANNPWAKRFPERERKTKPQQDTASTSASTSLENTSSSNDVDDENLDDDLDADIQRAIELSKEQTATSDEPKKEQKSKMPVLEIVLDKDEKVPTQEEVDKQVEQTVDAKLLADLLEMEFDKTRALKALLATGSKDQEAALEWIVDNESDPEIDAPILYKIITAEEREEKLKEAKLKAKELQKLAREKVAKIEKKNERERELRRIRDGKETLKVMKEFEEAQKKRDADAAKLEKKKLKEEKAKMKRILAEDQARRKIERLKREGNLEEAAQIEKEMGFTSTVQVPSSTGASQSASQKPADECMIRLRLLSGDTQACKFKPTDTLATVFQHASFLQNGNKRFSLMLAGLPRKVFTQSDMNKTLKDLDLLRASLVCSPAV